ncbi:neural cell adhesion molecule 1-like [Montipora capricornis]|uniref:neural cell adhesion molecule 1-like n=1 Tax=Montipora capricornis TaxID=246305 RepID=UPI0035F1F86E
MGGDWNSCERRVGCFLLLCRDSAFQIGAGFKDENLQQPLIYGRPGKIRCTAEGNPPPQFEWRKNDSVLLEKDRFTQLSDGSLRIDEVGREDKGAYKCSIKQTKGSERITVYSQVINVSVIVPPNVKLSGSRHNVHEGDNINLTCTVHGFPKPKISWFKDKLQLKEEEKENLVKRNITEGEEGTYACKAKNQGGSENDTFDVIVDAPPKLDAALKKNSMLVLFHSTLQLKCIERGDPEPNVTWTNNGTQVANNNTLVITNVTFKDAGQYGCVAKNRAGNVSGKIWIEVIVAPVVYVSPQNQTVVEGQTTNISCRTSGVPHPKLSWKFDNRELPWDAVITNTSNQSLLQLPKTAKNMEGWYKCIAKNEAGEEYSNSSLHVLEFPTAEISPNPYPTMLEGDKLTLTCKANEATWRITWEKNNVSKIPRANITENGDSSILLIEKVEVSDSGEYSCKVLNKAGSASSSVDIKIRGQQEQNYPKTRSATRVIEWYYIVGPFSAVVLSALIIWYLCKRRMTGTYHRILS